MRYVQGQKPQLVLLDEDGVSVETVSISSWTAETVGEYLDDMVVQRGSSSDEL